MENNDAPLENRFSIQIENINQAIRNERGEIENINLF